MPRFRFVVRSLSVLLLAVLASVAAAETPIVPPTAELEELWNEGEFTEGVAVAADGRVYFSDIPGAPEKAGRVLVHDPATGRTTVHCAESRKSNGLFHDSRGRLLAACGANNGARAICEITAEGEVRPLVERFEGRRFNSPNDLVVLGDGSLFFSDPRYVGDEPLELEHASVYRVSADRKSVTRATTDIEKPNGLHVSPDGRTLYVAETNNGAPTKPGRMTLNAFPIAADGTLGTKRVLVDFGRATGTDGMTIDTEGRIYAAVRDADRFGIRIFSPEGRELAVIPTPSLPTNCDFGHGSDAGTLYVTAGTGLYRIRLNARGFHPTRPTASR